MAETFLWTARDESDFVYGRSQNWIVRVGTNDMTQDWCGWIQRRSDREDSFFIDEDSLDDVKAFCQAVADESD